MKFKRGADMSYRFVLIVNAALGLKRGEATEGRLGELVTALWKSKPKVEVFFTADLSGNSVCYSLTKPRQNREYRTAALAIQTGILPSKNQQLLVLGVSQESLNMKGVSPGSKANTVFEPEITTLDAIEARLQDILTQPVASVATPRITTPLVAPAPAKTSGWRKWCCCGDDIVLDAAVPGYQ